MTENLDPNYVGNGIYRENILDHYKNPRNFGKLANANVEQKGKNPLCGDQISVQMKVIKGKIEEIKFYASGCAISVASSSMLTEAVKGKTLNEVYNLNTDKIMDMLNIPIGPVRTKCATLSLNAIKIGLREYEKNENTKN